MVIEDEKTSIIVAVRESSLRGTRELILHSKLLAVKLRALFVL